MQFNLFVMIDHYKKLNCIIRMPQMSLFCNDRSLPVQKNWIVLLVCIQFPTLKLVCCIPSSVSASFQVMKWRLMNSRIFQSIFSEIWRYCSRNSRMIIQTNLSTVKIIIRLSTRILIHIFFFCFFYLFLWPNYPQSILCLKWTAFSWFYVYFKPRYEQTNL